MNQTSNVPSPPHARAELSAFGAQALLRNERSNQNGFGCALSYQGPLFNGRPNSKGSVRLDVSTRREPVAVAPVLVTSGDDDIEPFIISRPIQTDWERDLKPLLATVPDFGTAEQMVLDNLA